MFKSIKIIVLCILVLITSVKSYAQFQKEDSIKNPQDYLLVKKNLDLGNAAYKTQNVDSIIHYFNTALELSKKNGFVYSQANSYYNLGKLYKIIGQADTALILFKKSAVLRRANKNYKDLNKTLTNMCFILYEKGESIKGLTISKEAVEAGKLAGYDRGYGIALMQRGNFYFNGARYETAFNDYKDASSIFKKIGFDDGVGMCYNGMANVNSNLQKHDQALKYHMLNFYLQRKTGNKQELANAATNLGSYYAGFSHDSVIASRRNIDSMFYYYNMGLDIYKEQNDIQGVIQATTNLGIGYIIVKDFDRALSSFNTAELLSKQNNNKIEQVRAQKNKGLMYYEKGEYLKSKDYYLQVLPKFIEFNLKEDEMMLYKQLCNTLDSLREYKDALWYLRKFEATLEKIRTNKTRDQINQLNEFYGSELKDEQIAKAVIREKSLQEKNEAQARFNLLLKIGLGAIGIFLILVFYQFIQKRKANKLLTESNEAILQQKEEIETQRNHVLSQKDIIEEQQTSILDSIHYASRIQEAILPQEDTIADLFSDKLFVLFKPRDIVSGDFYWMGTKGNKKIIVAADCTGHGVPGAFMSMLGTAFLNEIVSVSEDSVTSDDILNKLRQYVITSLRQTGKAGEQKDGMDLAICIYDQETRLVDFTGANNPLIVVRSASKDTGVEASKEIKVQSFNSETNQKDFNIIQFQGNKMPIGIYENQKPFVNTIYQLQEDDSVYIFSDGYQDQFGGPNNKKFMIKRLKQLFVNMNGFDMQSQANLLDKTLISWIKESNTEQVDDILMIGFKVV